MAIADKWRQHEAAIQEKALADEANEQRRQEVAALDATLAEMELATEQFCHEMAQLAAMLGKMASTRLHEAATLEKLLANEANEQCRAAAQEKALAKEANERRRAAARENALADEANNQRCHKSAERAVALVELVLSEEQHHHEVAKQAAMLAEKALAKERRHHKMATQEKALADEANKQRRAAAQEKALADEANEQRRAAARDKALADEANKRRRHELAKRAMTSATKALAKDKHNKDDDNVARQFEAYAAPLFACVDAIMAKIQAMGDGFGNWTAFGDEILAVEDDEASAPTMPPLAPPTAVLPTPHRPTSYVAVLSNIKGGAHTTPLIVAPSPRPLVEP